MRVPGSNGTHVKSVQSVAELFTFKTHLFLCHVIFEA